MLIIEHMVVELIRSEEVCGRVFPLISEPEILPEQQQINLR